MLGLSKLKGQGFELGVGRAVHTPEGKERGMGALACSGLVNRTSRARAEGGGKTP